MGDVKRYTMDENSLMDGMDMFEDDDGDYVLHSDYAALLTRHAALVEAVKKMLAADDDLLGEQWSAERHKRLQTSYHEARAEVDRRIVNEIAAGCKGEE